MMAGMKAVKSAILVLTAVLLAISSAGALRDMGVRLSTGKRSSRVAAGVDTQRKVMRLRGGVMWVGGGKQFNRTADPDASPEAQEDTFLPLRERLRAASGSANPVHSTQSPLVAVPWALETSCLGTDCMFVL